MDWPQVVRGQPDVEYEFENDDMAPNAARRALSSIVGSASIGDDVRLAASELVTNVVRHTDGGGHMRAWRSHPLRLEVHDASPLLPDNAPRGTRGGHGLRIVDQISSDWGATATPNGKMVWAEFDSSRA